MHLVICHALIRAVLHDHLEHPLHLPACLVQQVRIAVLLFRNLHGIVSIAVFCLTGNGTLILVLHHPQSNPAVHHVFSMIAGIVPAAGDILEIVPVRCDACGVIGVSCTACQCCGIPGGNILALNGDAAAVLVEIVEGIEQHAGVDFCSADGKFPTGSVPCPKRVCSCFFKL